MIILSQDKEKVIVLGDSDTLEYRKENFINPSASFADKEKHILVITKGTGTTEKVVAQYDSKERCLKIIKEFCFAYQDECCMTSYFDNSSLATIPVVCRKNMVFEFPEN